MPSSLSLTQPPVFLQEGEYSARLTRSLVSMVGTEGVAGTTAFQVQERAAGAAMQVEILAGKAFIVGDDQSNQNSYLVVSESTLTLDIEAADVTNGRIDRVVLQVRDTNAGVVSGDDAIVAVLTGTPSGSPSAPAVPDSAISLATIEVDAAAVSIVTADITDTRTQSSAPLTPPPALDDLTDVDVSGVQDNQALLYDSGTSEWTPGYAGPIFSTAGSDTVNISFSFDTVQTRAAAGNVTFTGSNYTAGNSGTVRIVAGASSRDFTFPAGWVFVSFKPASIPANKTAVLSVTSFGTVEADCVAAYAVEA